MEKCIGVISNLEIDDNFGTLCKNRPVYMLPFGGRYRIVDFAISNMVNYKIDSIAIYTGEKIRSTMDHLGNGSAWDLNRKFNGLFLFPPVHDKDTGFSLRDIQQFYTTEEFYTRAKEDYVFLMYPNYLAKVNLQEVFKYFKETDSDITLVYKRQKDEDGELINTAKIKIDENGRLINIGKNLGLENEFNQFLYMGFFKKEVFLNIIRTSIENGTSHNLMEAMLASKNKFRISTYEFKGHVESILDLKSYYEANLRLLDRDIFRELFYKDGTVFTKTKDEPSTTYKDISKVKNSLIANGCIIEGEVENSIIFRGVKVGKGAKIKNSIIMQKGVVGEDSIIVNSILDKYVEVEEQARLTGSLNMPYLVPKRGTVKKG